MDRGVSIGGVLYIIIGVLVANNYGYLADLSALGQLLSALLAIILWPLLFIGLNLHLGF